MSSKDFSIKQLVAYCLDYANLTTTDALTRSVSTGKIPSGLIDIDEVIFKSTKDKFTFRLRIAISEKEKDELDDAELEELNAIIERDRRVIEKIDEIDKKIRTQSYTKQVVLETGFAHFDAKKIKNSFLAKRTYEETDDVESFSRSLLQLPINISISYLNRNFIEVEIGLRDDSVSILINKFKDCIPQTKFDDLFSFVAESESKEKSYLPINKSFTDELWNRIYAQLRNIGAKNITERPNYSDCEIKLIGKANYFLTEDLDAITDIDEEVLLETAISGFISNDEMDIEESVSDKGDTEIFFPFPYDKWQLRTLGITKNKAIIVEGPPGTGKSQTIANLLVHLAATGNRVLFASQKDQAVRGVKDKLKELEIPFLFGYIPDRNSPLHSDEDERDSAANTLISLDKEFQKQPLLKDQKLPLECVDIFKSIFNRYTNIERELFDTTSKRNQLAKYGDFAKFSINKERYDEYRDYLREFGSIKQAIDDFEAGNERYIEIKDKMYRDLEITLDEEIEIINNIIGKFKVIMPERAGFINKKIVDIKLLNMLKSVAKNLIQEIYRDIEVILFDKDSTKTQKLRELELLKEYFEYSNCVARRDELIEQGKISYLKERQLFVSLGKLIGEEGEEQVFNRINEYNTLQDKLDGLLSPLKNNSQSGYRNINDIRKAVRDLQKYYRKDTVSYVRNRLLSNIDKLKMSKATRATLKQLARSLTKSKKAYKTFDKLKHDENNFDVMSEVLPIWMMSLDDVNRIIPLKAGAFDYVIMDEASQCNLAYAVPTMFRSKHTIFFGDSLQMRDTNTLFKSNEQLSSIAKKHHVPDQFQIKAEEDTIKSIMDIASLAGFKTAILKNHYRSPKELIGFSNQNYYEKVGRPLDVINDRILTYKDTNRVLINHVINVDKSLEDSEKTNHTEARYIKSLIDDIRNDDQLKNKSIAVLTFFNEQAELLLREINDDSIKISTIEGIQGDERDIVIYSFVITDATSGKKRYIALTGEGGEIRKGANEGRVNVAFSRARQQVHCVTCIPPTSWPDGVWIKKYLEYVEDNGFIQRQSKKDLHFDSHFEEEVFDYLTSSLPEKVYVIQTQVESCGFKIDQVITNIKSGKKLAIECDGPTHFENGDGQVYVDNDWERQAVLETAGWNFYRISCFDWSDNEKSVKKDVLDFIERYFSESSNHQTSKIVRDIKQLEIQPSEEPLNLYKTNIKRSSRHQSDTKEKYEEVNLRENRSRLPGGLDISTKNTKQSFSVGSRGVDQEKFGRYLASHVGNTIRVHYQSMRAGSAQSLRELRLHSYDAVYFYAARRGDDKSYRYRRDRVIEYK